MDIYGAGFASLNVKSSRVHFEPGVATYSVPVDWFGQLQLVEEAEVARMVHGLTSYEFEDDGSHCHHLNGSNYHCL